MHTQKLTLQTTLGPITLELFSELAPQTVNNFVTLAESGFYDGVVFHRVIENFMIQSGDPQSKEESLRMQWGTGGPGYTFEDEIHAQNRNVVGTIAMANAGPNTNGSQFFINVADNSFLDTKHTVFGRVIEGMDVVMAISQVETLPNDQPIDSVVITQITAVVE
ncbi:MAG: peptidylprolyl isomerase [Candidatus Pacebacteria bacterium]|nr:peptidylprolyl isomerase [Candidatus Paceibacterota bacterium]MCD8508151.1 peptidylprolyl isomerase [Candidatus Paceibacterota bacterium]MCD8528299.1 peptidylprolyl isomerase [Candidatus Paceibacterota bacterium]MCD8563412.1 peptidylprolyl isomerase [Candidatus Paceibacterota bacterium]